MTRSSLLAAVATNAAAGTLFAWSVLLPALSTEFGVPVGRLGAVFSTALVVFAAAVLVGGGAVDRHGPGWTAARAGLLSGGGLAVSAAAQSLVVLHVGMGLLFGAGSGLAYLSAVSWAGTQDEAVRPRVVGVVVAAYAAGPVAAAPLGAFGTEVLGWRWMLAASAVVVATVTVVASRGLPVAADRASSVVDPAPVPPRDNGVGDGRALASLWLVFFGTVVPGVLAFAYAADVAMERGLSSKTASLVVALMAVGNLAGRLLSAPVTTRLGLRAALWIGVATLGAALATLAWSSAIWPVLLGLPLVALAYGMVSALLPGATRKVSTGGRFGTAYGRVFSSFGVAAVVGPWLGAALHQEADGYLRSFGASFAAASVAVFALAAFHRRTSTPH